MGRKRTGTSLQLEQGSHTRSMRHRCKWQLLKLTPMVTYSSQLNWAFIRATNFFRTLEPKLVSSFRSSRLQLATFTGLSGACGWVITSSERISAQNYGLHSSHDACELQPYLASISEGPGFSFVFLSPEYRRNVFFVYEKRLRVYSPPEKVFEYFSSVKVREGTFMTSLDLMRAAVPVFQPVSSSTIRSGCLGGEHKDAAFSSLSSVPHLLAWCIFGRRCAVPCSTKLQWLVLYFDMPNLPFLEQSSSVAIVCPKSCPKSWPKSCLESCTVEEV